MAEDQDQQTDQTSTAIAPTSSTQKGPGFVLARIKPFNPRQGIKIRSYTYKGTRFREPAGWYRVSAALGDELRNLYADESDPMSPLVFDVLSEEEALLVEERERKRRERASALAPNQTPALRNADARRAVRAAQSVQGATPAGQVRVTDAPNDEVIPNGYPPARVYPMPQPIGVQTAVNYRDAPAVEEGTNGELLNNTAVAGASDKDVGVAGANIARDQQGVAPYIADGQGTIDDGDNFNLEGTDTDFGPDHTDADKPAGPPSARRKKRST